MNANSIPAQVLSHLESGNTGTSREIADALGLDPKKVSSALSRLAKSDQVAKDGNNFYLEAPESAEEAVSEPEEDLIGALLSPRPTKPWRAQRRTGAVIDFPGNYSIVFAPGAALVAEAAGVRVKTVNVPGRLNRQVFFETGEQGDAVAAFINSQTPRILAELKAWQKATRDERRDLTDMQRFLQHRLFISTAWKTLASIVEDNGLAAVSAAITANMKEAQA